jgi:hypothetical protein
VIGLLKQRISAGTVLDRFEAGKPADQFDFYGRGSTTAFRDLSAVDRPILVIYCKVGELVGPNGVDTAIETLRRRAVRAPAFESLVVDGGHWYMGWEDDAMGTLLRWSQRVVDARA